MKCGYISIIGKPNSGKSTLLNRIVGEQLSIVTDKPQTTRQNIMGIHNIPGAQMIFLDTPGLHKSEKPLNRYMMEQLEATIRDTDIIFFVVDISRFRMTDTRYETFEEDLRNWVILLDPKKTIIILNKLDKIMDGSWENAMARYKERFSGYHVVGVSAVTGYGIVDLIANVTKMLPDGGPFYPGDIYTEHPVRFLVGELIREQVFHLMHQEIPYSTAVEVEEYKEEPDIHRIMASIIVEKESQKGMVIGKDGQMIKKIGELARPKIEDMVGVKVYLRLFVKVEKNWTKDPKAFKRLYNY